MTFDEYLAIEERSPIHHELVGGQLYAMTGWTKRHNEVAARIFSLARQHIGEHCAAYISDVMLRVGDTGYYPDVMVTCDPDDHDRYETRPCLLVEVLSTRSTRRESVAAGLRSLALASLLPHGPELVATTARLTGKRHQRTRRHRRRGDVGRWCRRERRTRTGTWSGDNHGGDERKCCQQRCAPTQERCAPTRWDVPLHGISPR